MNSGSVGNKDLSNAINKPSLNLLAKNYLGNGNFKKPMFDSKEYKDSTAKLSEIINLNPLGFKSILGK